MKKFKFMTLALAALTLGACSSDDDSLNVNQTNAEGKSFVSISLNLPTRSASSTRAENDKFEDGIASEYAMKNGYLLLFGGTSEAEATFQSAYDLTSALIATPDLDNDNITTQYTAVAEVTKPTGDNCYALIVLNKNSVFELSGTDITIGGTSQSGNKLSDIMATLVSGGVSALNGNGFFMTNAPIVNLPGNAAMTGAVTTIMPEISASFYPTQAQALANTPISISVERAVAKVSVTGSNGTVATKPVDKAGTTFIEMNYEILGWELANVNTTSYFIRNWNQITTGITTTGDAWYGLASNSPTVTAGSNEYRFAGTAQIKEPNADAEGFPTSGYYRTYWGIDPNYNKDATDPVTPIFDEVTKVENDKADKYCMENTFDVARMNVMNTTCAIIKVKVSPTTATQVESDGTFYVVDGNTNVIYKETEAKEFMINKFDLEKYIADNSGSGGDYEGKTGTFEITSLEWAYDATTEKMQAKKFVITLTPTSGTAETFEIADATVLSTMNAANIVKYDGGVAYYTVLIKHFGDELTPWNVDETSKPSATEAYPSNSEANYLGRYGVLRNNWYEISITGVKQIGSATVPNVHKDATPDDQVKQYIAARINVLSWAKRTQSEVLE